MARHLFIAKPLSEPVLAYCYLDPVVQISVKFESKYNFQVEKNELKNAIFKMAATWSRPWRVNLSIVYFRMISSINIFLLEICSSISIYMVFLLAFFLYNIQSV